MKKLKPSDFREVMDDAINYMDHCDAAYKFLSVHGPIIGEALKICANAEELIPTGKRILPFFICQPRRK